MNPKTVNIIKSGALGDTIVGLPVAEMLKRAWPDAFVMWIGSHFAEQLGPALPYVDATRPLDGLEMLPLFMQGRPESVSGRLRTLLEADLTLAFQKSPASMAGRWHELGGGRFIALPAEPTQTPIPASRFLCLECADALDLPAPASMQPRLELPESARLEAAQWLDSVWRLKGGHLIAVHPGSGSPAKCWPPENYARLIARAERELGLETLLVEGPADRDAVESVQNRLDGRRPVMSGAPLLTVAALIGMCGLFAGSDSGLAHLAAAVGAAVAVVFGPTDRRVWAPAARRVEIVSVTVSCSPCSCDMRAGCPDRLCLNAVSVDMMLDALKRLSRP